jgi:vitamin B12 transporter
MLDSIERIEVVRGNVSSLYGSEAIGGVIQLFSKQGRGTPEFNVSAGAGSHGTQRYSTGFSGAVDETSFSVNAGNVKTNGVSSMNPLLVSTANPNSNGYDNNTFNGQVKHNLSAGHALSASLFSTRGNSSFDNGVATDINNLIQRTDKFSVASDNQLSDAWHSQLRLAQGVDDSHSYTNGLLAYRFQTRSNQLVWQNNFKMTETQRMTFAAEHLAQTIGSDTAYTQTARKVNSLLGGYVAEYGAQQVQLNLRQDRYSDFGTANTGLLGYGLSFANSWRATASISNAFKAPTFNDMFYPFQNYGIFGSYAGNPNLKPERSRNKEIGLHYAAHGQRIDLVYFDNRIRDLIASNNLFAGSVININQAQITGQELNYTGELGNHHLAAHLTFQNPRDGLTGQILQRRAKQFGSASVSRDWNDWNAGMEVRYSGVRHDYDPVSFNAVTLPGYQLLNLTSRYQIEKNLHVSARVDNLFNRNYSEAYGYNTLGRSLFVGLTYQQ